MKRRIFYLVFAIATGIILAGCGGGSGDSSSSTGTISMNITDAKPVLPVSDVESVSITFDEVSVHKSGGGWVALAAVHQPYIIDLYQFSDGTKTQFVPPVQLVSGKYTQVRIGVTSGTIRINGVDHPLEIPSENLKTDKNFEFNVQGGGAVDLTVDFDLSQSIVLTGSGTYQLKPVLHLNLTQEAATIQGSIKASTFGSSSQMIVIVMWDKDNNEALSAGDEVYTKIQVNKEGSGPTQFRIYWLVPDESYIVQIKFQETDPAPVYQEAVDSTNLQAGAVFSLNGGNSI